MGVGPEAQDTVGGGVTGTPGLGSQQSHLRSFTPPGCGPGSPPPTLRCVQTTGGGSLCLLAAHGPSVCLEPAGNTSPSRDSRFPVPRLTLPHHLRPQQALPCRGSAHTLCLSGTAPAPQALTPHPVGRLRGREGGGWVLPAPAQASASSSLGSACPPATWAQSVRGYLGGYRGVKLASLTRGTALVGFRRRS